MFGPINLLDSKFNRVTVAGNSNPTHMNKTAACMSAFVMSTRNGAKHQNNSVDVGTLTAAPSHGGIHLNAQDRANVIVEALKGVHAAGKRSDVVFRKLIQLYLLWATRPGIAQMLFSGNSVHHVAWKRIGTGKQGLTFLGCSATSCVNPTSFG
jgi:hypothetical protein